MHIKPIRHRHLLVAFVGGMACTIVQAAPPAYGGDADHDRARHALARGEVRPIADILRRVAAEIPGEVVEVEFERQGRHNAKVWVYELKIIANDGRLLEVLVDAATARILDVEED